MVSFGILKRLKSVRPCVMHPDPPGPTGGALTQLSGTTAEGLRSKQRHTAGRDAQVHIMLIQSAKAALPIVPRASPKREQTYRSPSVREAGEPFCPRAQAHGPWAGDWTLKCSRRWIREVSSCHAGSRTCHARTSRKGLDSRRKGSAQHAPLAHTPVRHTASLLLLLNTSTKVI